MQTLAEVRDPASIVVEEAPSSRPAMQRHLPILRSETFYTMDSGGLGFGLPAAVGVALAQPERAGHRPHRRRLGMYSIQALWSAAQLELPITFVILKNRRYAALQEFAPAFGFAAGEQLPGTELPGIDFVALARGRACEDAVRVERAEELRDALGGGAALAGADAGRDRGRLNVADGRTTNATRRSHVRPLQSGRTARRLDRRLLALAALRLCRSSRRRRPGRPSRSS